MNEGTGEIRVWRDHEIRSASEQMAVDGRLLRDAEGPTLRFYQWEAPAITIGYFVSEAPVARAYPGLEIARRQTGGGIVEHGDDVTFALVVPRKSSVVDDSPSENLLRAPAPERYRWIHEKLAAALRSSGIDAALVSASRLEETNPEPGRCFSAPVVSDVVDFGTGKKIAGGAQRRTREGWIHQGSVRLDPPHDWIDAKWTQAFCEEIAGNSERIEVLPNF